MSPSDELRELWRRVDAQLRASLAMVQVDPETRRLAVEFLDHNELGLAFQTLAGGLAASESALPPAARVHLAAAAAEMGLEDDADWQRLKSARL